MGRKTYSASNNKILIKTNQEGNSFNKYLSTEYNPKDDLPNEKKGVNITPSLFKGETIAITSAKGGVGKSTITAHIGYNLAMMGKRVCVIDACFDNRSLDIFLALSEKMLYDLRDVLEGRCSWKKAAIKYQDNFYFIPAPPPDYSENRIENIDGKRLQEIIRDIRKEFEYIIIDSPSLSENHFETIIKSVNKTIAVVTPSISSLRSTDVLLSYFKNMDMPLPPLIINKFVKSKYGISPELLEVDEIESILAANVLDYILDEQEILLAELCGTLIEYCEISSTNSLAFYNISKRIIGEEVLVPEKNQKKKKGLFR